MSLSPLELLIQFVIAVAIFFLCMRTFFSKLLVVLQERESKTTILDEQAEKKMLKAHEMEASYQQKVEGIHRQAQQMLKTKKEEVIRREDQKYKEQDTQNAQLVEQQRERVARDVHNQKAAVLQEAEGLARTLTNRLTGES